MSPKGLSHHALDCVPARLLEGVLIEVLRVVQDANTQGGHVELQCCRGGVVGHTPGPLNPGSSSPLATTAAK